MLYRLLRTLASVGVFTEVAGGLFALTPLAESLRTDALKLTGVVPTASLANVLEGARQ